MKTDILKEALIKGGADMGKSGISAEEKAWLDTYDINQYDRPSVAADMAVFSIMGLASHTEGNGTVRKADYRKDPEKGLKLLLIRRASFPCRDCWALPGGFGRREESTKETAYRELYEETGVKDAYLQPFDIFSETGRDPRGWIISHAFLTLIDGEKYQIRGGSDAWEAQWFCIQVERQEQERRVEAQSAEISSMYTMKLICWERDALKLTAQVKERKQFVGYHEKTTYEIVEPGGLAFDHAIIILRAFLHLQGQVERGGKMVFDLMPEEFTLSELQKAYEAVLGRTLLTANFRRKISDFVTETEHIVEGAGHRPARLFRRNLHAFYDADGGGLSRQP